MSTIDYLIVDDDDTFAATLARSLKRRGFDSALAPDESSALALCRQHRPARIVLDMKLGATSGLNLIERLKTLSPASAIVVLTGYSSIATTVEAIKLGAENYLCKPASLTEIITAFEREETGSVVTIPDDPLSVDRLEWEHIQRTLAANDGNISATARALGMHRRTLQRKLQKRPVKS